MVRGRDGGGERGGRGQRARGEAMEGAAALSEPQFWHDGSPISLAEREREEAVAGRPLVPPPLLCPWEPPDGCVPASWTSLRQFNRTFVDEGSPGVIFRPMYEKMKQALRWPEGAPKEPRLLHDDGEHQLLLPAFCRLLQELAPTGSLGRRGCVLVLRTYGSDLERVVAAMAAFSEGKHPLFPNPGRLAVPVLWSGRYSPEGEYHLLRGGETDTHPSDARPWEPGGMADAEAVAALQASGIAGVRDDYYHWKSAAYAPLSGKPLWLTLDDDSWHHIFFDDNIHNKASDSIVAVRVREAEGQPFFAVSGDHTRRLHGAFLRKVPTWQPILDPEWFVDQIAECETRRRALVAEKANGLWSELRAFVRNAAAFRGAGVTRLANGPSASSTSAQVTPTVPGCRQCESARGGRAPVLWQDEHWTVVHKQPPCGVVGHLLLISKRHFQGPSAFTDDEARAIGLALRRCERALERVTRCDRVYTAALGSPANPHFHAHMLPLYTDSSGPAAGHPPISVTGTPFDVFLQEKLAKEGAEGATADTTKCEEIAAAWCCEMEAIVREETHLGVR